jgi:hypothetical protein
MKYELHEVGECAWAAIVNDEPPAVGNAAIVDTGRRRSSRHEAQLPAARPASRGAEQKLYVDEQPEILELEQMAPTETFDDLLERGRAELVTYGGDRRRAALSSGSQTRRCWSLPTWS